MKYFAYGSNMSVPRITVRLPSATKLGVYRLAGSKLMFHKASIDGSAKCDALKTDIPNDFILGVLFDIADDEKTILDKIEGVGKGYELADVVITNDNAEQVEAFMYVATDIKNNIQPYDWYKHHVVYGAKQANLPADYIESINKVEAKLDPDKSRYNQEMAIYNNHL